ncbi:glycosyltransferase [Roseicyclus persicicus]|uniref:Glycosyltransferase family 1 protein n=1 Tax=Roseicyclus persicicus TaxID=2650661 RepID=A0A7X6H0U8_9RHOB|nr:glycosyltransferase family 1 protein [Roseibacterium persicicum]NKX45954.1 glycosyltransferase family 1 protein [Roseibacterium persicicum]
MIHPRVLLANEAGAGRGHLLKLAAVARALGPGPEIVAAIADLRHAAALGGVAARVLAAPPLRYTRAAREDPTLEGNATWGDYLAGIGLVRADVVRRGLAWWRKAIVDEDASLLVADYAPLAILAAQGLKADGWRIEIVAVGTGYGTPPATLARFPRLLPDFARSLHSEEAILSVVNRVAGETGLDPLPRLPAIGAADLTLPMTLPFLDPYAGGRAAGELLAPLVDMPGPTLPPAGDELFVYAAAGELKAGGLVDALSALPMRRRGFLPGVSPETAARLVASGMVLEPAPLAAEVIARRTRLWLHAAQHGSLCTAAVWGIPQVAIPQQLEQLCHGRRMEAAGGLHLLPLRESTPEAIRAAVLTAWSDGALARQARDLSRALRAAQPARPMDQLAERLAPVLARIHADPSR